MVDGSPTADGDSSVSQGAYARLRGVSPQYISKLVRARKLTLVDGRVVPRLADAQLAALADGNREAVRQANARRRKGSVPAGGVDPAASLVDNPLAAATAEDKKYAGLLKRIEYEARLGNMVPRQAVELACQHNAEAARKMLERIPDRLAARLAAESDARRVRGLLIEEIEGVCREIATAAQALPHKLAASGVTQ